MSLAFAFSASSSRSSTLAEAFFAAGFLVVREAADLAGLLDFGFSWLKAAFLRQVSGPATTLDQFVVLFAHSLKMVEYRKPKEVTIRIDQATSTGLPV